MYEAIFNIYLAEVLINMNNDREALGTINLALNLQPCNKLINFLKCLILLKLQWYEEAIFSLERALSQGEIFLFSLF